MNQMNILFDLDGTLTNPYQGITACIRHALMELGSPVPQPEDLANWIGPPLHDSFLGVLGCPDQATQAVTLYRDRFATLGLYENELYEGIPAMLSALKQQGHRLWVSTSKPQIFAQKIVQHFDLTDYFVGIYGSELNGDRAHKDVLIAHVLTIEALDPDATVMVGDRAYDMLGAQRNAVQAIGVTWGFGSDQELIKAGANALCHSPPAFIMTLQTLTEQPDLTHGISTNI